MSLGLRKEENSPCKQTPQCRIKKRISSKHTIWCILLYRCETWTLRKYEQGRSEAMEMRTWRRMTRTSWIERKTNEAILEQINEKRTLLKTIMRRKIKSTGHLIRHKNFITKIY